MNSQPKFSVRSTVMQNVKKPSTEYYDGKFDLSKSKTVTNNQNKKGTGLCIKQTTGKWEDM